jgi:8-oxo-dGTP diphosphatase
MIDTHNPRELIAIVDENDKVIEKYPRRNHANGRLHRETSVLIVNSKNEILVQERADTRKLDYSASGHFPYYEDYLDGAVREVEEELGLLIDRSKFKKISKHRINYSGRHVNNRFVTLFEVRGNYRIDDLKINLSEVKSVRYCSISELKYIIENNPERMSEGFIESLKIYFEKIDFK